jgi:hypothetical protein
MKRPYLLLLVGLQIGATDCGQIITDRGFDLWCGDQLCHWKLETGEIERVATWIDGDDGVAMHGDEVVISQMTAVTSADTDCIQFEMVADIDELAEVTIEADVFGDGTIDWTERVPTAEWEKVSLRIGIDGAYQGIKFRIVKRGAGQAVLARIGAETADDCPTFEPIVARPEGASCLQGPDCDSGICNQQVCSDCGTSADCGGDVCGAEQHAPGTLADWWTCVAPASRGLGELCHVDAECASGICNGLLCSECDGTRPCTGGDSCDAVGEFVWANACAPNQGDRAAGAGCFSDADCASGACAGTPLGHCDDGPLPCFDDAECPPHADSTPATCTFVAVAGGTCQ